MDAARSAINDLEQRERLVREMEAKCKRDKATTATQCQKMLAHAKSQAADELSKLEAAREEILKLKGRIEHDVSTIRERVRLNVGGMKFETTLSTLTRYEETYFSAAFSGRHEVPLDSEGYYFIDRDGTHFGKILNFLRTENMRMPADRQAAHDLMTEVRYYMLEEPVRAALGELEPMEAATPAEYTRKEVWQMRQNGVTFFDGCNFAGLNLSYIDFEGCTLCGADFSGADLKRANFLNAKVAHANFDGANLSAVNWEGCSVGSTWLAQRPKNTRGVDRTWYAPPYFQLLQGEKSGGPHRLTQATTRVPRHLAGHPKVREIIWVEPSAEGGVQRPRTAAAAGDDDGRDDSDE
jgi:hypothetical protein